MIHTFRRQLLQCEGPIRKVIDDAKRGEAPLNIVFHCRSGRNRSPVGLAAALVVAAVVAAVGSSRSSRCTATVVAAVGAVVVATVVRAVVAAVVAVVALLEQQL